MKKVFITVTALSIFFSMHAQNIGIGTLTPYSKLHVNGTGWFQGDNTPLPAAAGKGIAIGYGSVGYIYSYDYQLNQPKDLILQHAGGNLGIGTTTPAAKLHLVKDNEALRIQGNSPYLSFYDATGVYKGFLWQGPGVDNISLGTAIGNFGHLEFYNSGIKNLTLNSNGLGILAGTSATLELWDDGYRSGVIEADATNSLEISASRTEAIGATPGNLILQTGYNGNFGFVRAGNVGIGTRNPTSKLSVNGNIQGKEVVVETGWADYVLDKSYKLPLLSDVEKFILENKHLPNIPTAAEIEKNGLPVGDMQKKMMEKIEELTLYIIQLKKELDTLKQSQNKE